jgi:GRAM domain-containing protein 4
MLYFTYLTSGRPEFTIHLGSILAVKKSGVARGLKIRWTDTGPDGVLQDEREERFFWVGDRDNLFARLVSRNAQRRLGS